MGWLGRGSFRGIGFCVKWIFGNWKMRVDARWLTATNPIWNAHLCAFTTLVDWKQWATDQLTTNELWFAKVFEKVARSTNKSAFFSKTSVVFFFAAGAGCRGWLHAHRGSGTTVQVCWCESQSLGCCWDCCDGESANEGPGGLEFVGIPWFVLSLFNSPWMKEVGEMRNQILVKFYSELLWNAMHITSVWHSILASGSMEFFESDYPRIWAICATVHWYTHRKRKSSPAKRSNPKSYSFTFIISWWQFTLPIPTRIGICWTGFLLLAIAAKTLKNNHFNPNHCNCAVVPC